MSVNEKSGFVVTERDREVVWWLGRVKVASIEQVKARFGLGQTQVYARLKGLRDVGLVERERVLQGFTVFYATSRGLRVVGCSLPPVSAIRLGSLTHDLAATDAVVILEKAKAELLTEREIRQEHRALGEQPYCTDIDEPGRMYRSKHTPDIVILGPGGSWVAVEVELTTKASRRTKAILDGYRLQGDGFVGVLYLVPTERDKARIQMLAEKEWLSNYGVAVKDSPTEIFKTLRALVDKGKHQHQL